MKYFRMACLGVAFLCGACGEAGPPPAGEAVVARVGRQEITEAHLLAYVEQLPDNLRSEETGDAARRQYLQALIDRQVLLMEARDLGLDTTQATRQSVQEALDNRVRSLFQAREIRPQIEITEDEIRRHFDEEGYARERNLHAIMVKSRADIDTVLAQLQTGRPFAEVAAAYSLDQRSAKQGGEVGFIGRDKVQTYYIPPEVFRTLPAGEISAPMRAGSGNAWHVIRFVEERPAVYEKYHPVINARLFSERLAQLRDDHVERLKESLRVRLEPAGVEEVVAAYGQKNPDALAGRPTHLYVFDGGAITVGDAREALQKIPPRGLDDNTQAVRVLERAVLRPVLLSEAGRRAGLYEEPEIHRLEKETLENILLETLGGTVFAEQADVSEEEVRQYYADHRETFHHEEAFVVEELLVPTELEAGQLKEQLAGGATFAELADRSLRRGGRESEGRGHFHPREKSAYPTMVPAVMAAPIGQLVGPLEVKGGYSVFTSHGLQEGEAMPYEDARRWARNMLRREREEQALNTLLQRLRSEYASQIEIDESRLTEALPDSLVQG